MLNVLSFFGIFGLCLIAWLGSENRRAIPWKLVFWGIGLQLVLGALVFLVPVTRSVVVVFNELFNGLIDAADAGGRFLFGSVFVPDPQTVPGPILAGRWIARAITPPYVPVPGDRLAASNLDFGYVFAFRVLPQVIFFSALVALLYNLRLIQPIVRFLARLFHNTLSISGAEALAGATNIFVGIESAIAVKPFLADMTRSELCALLTCCFGTIASTVLALYAGFLRPVFPLIAGHLMSASILAIPACFVLSKILVPEQETPKTLGELPPEASPESTESTPSAIESLIDGAMDGVRLAVGIAALLIAILGLVAIVNLLFANFASLSGSSSPVLQNIGRVFAVLSLQNILGALFLPLTFLTGLSLNWQELWQASVLIGQRLLVTEIPSYLSLAQLAAEGAINDRALLITSYVLCGFAHIPSLAIFVGGLAALAPTRRRLIGAIAWKSLWAATLATLMIGCIAGVFDFGNPTILGK